MKFTRGELCLDVHIKALMSEESFKVDGGVVLRQAVRHLAVAGTTHIKTNPPVAERIESKQTVTESYVASETVVSHHLHTSVVLLDAQKKDVLSHKQKWKIENRSNSCTS